MTLFFWLIVWDLIWCLAGASWPRDRVLDWEWAQAAGPEMEFASLHDFAEVSLALFRWVVW